MKNDETAVQGGTPGERREPSLPKTTAPMRYVQTSSARREPQLPQLTQLPQLPASASPSATWTTSSTLQSPARSIIADASGGTISGGQHHGNRDGDRTTDNRGDGGAASGGRSSSGAGSGSGSGNGNGNGNGSGSAKRDANAQRSAANPGSSDGSGEPAGAPPIPELERMKGVGDTLNGRFVLEECIGFGGMGMVYKALDLRKLEASDRKPYIAIKVLNVQFRGHPKSLIALQREARKAQALAHPNIVAVYDFDRDGSMVYLTMEYLVGEPLSRRVRAPDFSGMPLAQAMPIIAGMARGLAYAHQRGFVHCDLKPANVFLTERGDVKVIDFGIARVFQKTEEDQDATVFDAGSLGGLTPAYASPEMLEHRVPDPRDDIYALACITYELLVGRHPFDRLSALQARGAGMKPQRPPQLGRRQWRALRAALSFERETRMPSVLRFLDEIDVRKRIAPAAMLAGGGGVAALVVAAWLFHRAGVGETADEPAQGGSSGTVQQDDGRNTGRSAGGALSGLLPQPGSGGVRTPVPFERAPLGSPPQIVVPSEQGGAAGAGGAQGNLAQRPPPVALASVTPIIARVPCAALTASVSDHAVDIRGFVSEKYDATRLKSQLLKLPGVESLNLDTRAVPETACATLTLLAPYWQQSRQSGAHVRTRAPDGQLTEGEPLIVDVTTPNYDTWVHVDYFVRDGGVAHLLPSLRARDNQAPPSYSATIGSFGNWVISKPFGNELIVLMTTPAPLFDGLRPESESGPAYMRALKKQLRQMSARFGQQRIAVDFVQITTRAKQNGAPAAPAAP